jgi:hypothetical protein
MTQASTGEDLEIANGRTNRPNGGPAKTLKWSGPGSNRRHMDFQSIALPTELPDPRCRKFKSDLRICQFVPALENRFRVLELSNVRG